MSDNNNGSGGQARVQGDPVMSSGTASGQDRMGAFYLLSLLVLSFVAVSTLGHQDNGGTHVSISLIPDTRQRELGNVIFLSPYCKICRFLSLSLTSPLSLLSWFPI